MRKYIRLKNQIISILVCFIYYSYIVPNVPVVSEIFGCIAVCFITMLALEYFDCRKKVKIKARKENEKSASVGKPNALG